MKGPTSRVTAITIRRQRRWTATSTVPPTWPGTRTTTFTLATAISIRGSPNSTSTATGSSNGANPAKAENTRMKTQASFATLTTSVLTATVTYTLRTAATGGFKY